MTAENRVMSRVRRVLAALVFHREVYSAGKRIMGQITAALVKWTARRVVIGQLRRVSFRRIQLCALATMTPAVRLRLLRLFPIAAGAPNANINAILILYRREMSVFLPTVYRIQIPIILLH